jgi:cyclophilin family peptidyl-prolyl cis-trans isomerase
MTAERARLGVQPLYSSLSRRGRRPRPVRLALEGLEERKVPATLLPDTVGVFDPGTATWYLRSSNSAGAPDAGTFAYGAPGWEPVTGDWASAGRTALGVVDPATATWYLRNENSAGAPDAGQFAYGAPGWVPVVGDWTGSGHTGIGMYNPATATWYLRNSPSAGAPDFTFTYGAPGWTPVTGNWAAGSRTTVGVVDPTTMTWYLRNENSAGAPDAGQFAYGAPGWKPVTGDWTGNGSSTVGVVDPAGNWYLRNSDSPGAPDLTFAYGLGAWAPVAGAWNAQDTPFVNAPIADASLAAQGSTVVDLAGNFSDANITDSLVRFDTSAGTIFVELFDQQAPRTVANFLDYVTDGAYTNSIFHRSAKLADGTPFVLQGGGFTFQGNPSRLAAIAAASAVQNEPDPANRSNVRGTIAMAKLGNDPNSATDQFFFNLDNNSANLDNQNGGFTVFGKVLTQADQQTLDTLAAIPTQDQSAAQALPSSEQGVFNEIPLQNYTGSNFPTDTSAANYALINGVTVVRRTEVLTYSVVGNTNPAVVSTNVVHNRLTLQAGQAGTTTLTVRATNQEGASVDTTFNVTVA